jgi:hypothetical protein
MEFTIPSDILERAIYTINIENAIYETVVLEDLQPVSRLRRTMNKCLLKRATGKHVGERPL